MTQCITTYTNCSKIKQTRTMVLEQPVSNRPVRTLRSTDLRETHFLSRPTMRTKLLLTRMTKSFVCDACNF